MIPTNPYADWDRETFVEYGADPQSSDAPRLHPVYVGLAATSEAEVDAFIQGAGDDGPGAQYMLDALGLNILTRLKIALRLGKAETAARLSRLYVYRRSEVAYSDAGMAFEVLGVGPALAARLAALGGSDLVDDSADTIQGVAAFEANLALPAQSLPVLTGVIDDVMGIANARFRDGPTSSRIHHFWPQQIQSARGQGGRLVSGPLLTKASIDALLAGAATGGQVDEVAFFDALYPDQKPGSAGATLTLQDPTARRPLGFRATHGTHVLDLAAGEAMEDAVQDRPIVAVQLPALATAETWGARLEHAILTGVQAILNWADSWPGGAVPCVINLSYGVQAGPKNGQGFLEREVARLIAARNAEGILTRLVLPAGNGYRDKSRAEMSVSQTDGGAVTWRVLPLDQSSNFIEIWSDGPVGVALRAPSGEVVLGTNASQDWTAQGHLIGRLYAASRSGAQNVTIALAGTLSHRAPGNVAAAGAYEIEVSTTSAQPVSVSVEVHRDETPNTQRRVSHQSNLSDSHAYGYDAQTGRLEAPTPYSAITREGTLSAFATADAEAYIYVVGGVFSGDDPLVPSRVSASAAGLVARTPTGVAVSDDSLAHAGQLAAGTFSGSVIMQGGTSVACPQVARALVSAGGSMPVPTGAVSDPRLGLGAWDIGPAHRTRPPRRVAS